jgi:probable F420-dependent oxidoreductase
MEFAIMLSGSFGHPSPDNCQDIALKAEQTGFDCILFGDHIALPASMAVKDHTGVVEDNPSMFETTNDIYEVFNMLSYLAGTTNEIALGTNVVVAPYRHPALLAKNALTVEQLSDGRFEFGVGVGWAKDEFEMLDTAYEKRGLHTEEFLELFDRARKEGVCSYKGELYSVPETGFHPMPEPDRPPLWIGAQSSPAYRRVAKYGTGWTAPSLATVDLATEIDRLSTAWQDHDRSGEPEIAVMLPLDSAQESEVSVPQPIDAAADELQQIIRDLEELGVTRTVFAARTLSGDQILTKIDHLGRYVLGQYQ